MPMTQMTMARTKKIVLAHIEKAGEAGIPVESVSRYVSSSLWRDGLIIRRGNVWVAVAK